MPEVKDFKRNYPLKNVTTIRIGGPAKYFCIVRSAETLVYAIEWAKRNKVSWYVIGEGSNIIPNDSGFRGLIIKNQIKNLKRTGNKVYVGAGDNLLEFIRRVNRFGMAGMEKMAGIPGTVGGAIYGCAGAYGQEISNCLVRVRIYDGKTIKWISKAQCRFNYRGSIFKAKKNWIIFGAEFEFREGTPQTLTQTSREIIKLRERKYRPGLLCPGSFFKNIVVCDIAPVALRKKFLAKFDNNKIMYGKVPAGYILELVGSNGIHYGGIRVAIHHGNLIYNSGKGRALEIKKLVKILKRKVRRKFGIELEEEVQYL